MKIALWITYDIVLDDDLMDLFDEFGIVGYTHWPRISGRGPKSGARLDNHVWPGANAALMTVQEEETIQRLMTRLQLIRDDVGELTGLWAFTTPILSTLQ